MNFDGVRMGLPNLANLAADRKGFSEFIHRTVKGPHGRNQSR